MWEEKREVWGGTVSSNPTQSTKQLRWQQLQRSVHGGLKAVMLTLLSLGPSIG